MSIQIKINNEDRTEIIEASVNVKRTTNNVKDSASFNLNSIDGFKPEFNDDVAIYDGDDKVFGGSVLSVKEEPFNSKGDCIIRVDCVGYSAMIDSLLVNRVFEGNTVGEIIQSIVSDFAPDFTTNNVECSIVVDSIVFSNEKITACLERLADITGCRYYIGVDKDVHFFAKNSRTAPFGLTDTNGHLVSNSLVITEDGSQLANVVRVRGGEYDALPIENIITVVGSETKMFEIGEKMSNLEVWLSTDGGVNWVAQVVGLDSLYSFGDIIDGAGTINVLHNFNSQSIKWEGVLTDGTLIKYSGNPKRQVLQIAEDSGSVSRYGRRIEKVVEDQKITSMLVAKQRAKAELINCASVDVSATFETFDAGLIPGMIVAINSDNRQMTKSLLINTVSYSMRGNNKFCYKVELAGTRQLEFAELLKKIIKNEDKVVDEAKSENLFLANETIIMTEKIVPLDGEPANETLKIFDSARILNITPNFVLAPYIPTGDTDSKRPGRLGISLKLK